MSELMTLQEDLDDALNQLEKQIGRVKNRRFFLSEKLIIEAIKNIDDLTISLRKQAFN